MRQTLFLLALITFSSLGNDSLASGGVALTGAHLAFDKAAQTLVDSVSEKVAGSKAKDPGYQFLAAMASFLKQDVAQMDGLAKTYPHVSSCHMTPPIFGTYAGFLQRIGELKGELDKTHPVGTGINVVFTGAVNLITYPFCAGASLTNDCSRNGLSTAITKFVEKGPPGRLETSLEKWLAKGRELFSEMESYSNHQVTGACQSAITAGKTALKKAVAAANSEGGLINCECKVGCGFYGRAGSLGGTMDVDFPFTIPSTGAVSIRAECNGAALKKTSRENQQGCVDYLKGYIERVKNGSTSAPHHFKNEIKNGFDAQSLIDQNHVIAYQRDTRCKATPGAGKGYSMETMETQFKLVEELNKACSENRLNGAITKAAEQKRGAGPLLKLAYDIYGPPSDAKIEPDDRIRARAFLAMRHLLLEKHGVFPEISNCAQFVCEWTWYDWSRNDRAVMTARRTMGCAHPEVAAGAAARLEQTASSVIPARPHF